jgi:ribokinase
MKVLVFGSLNIDLIFSVEHIALAGETISSSALVKSAGGKGANQAAALAKAGMDVYMAGKIGANGRFLLDMLHSYGVNCDKVAFYDGDTGQALIQLDTQTGQNAIVLYGGGNSAISEDEISVVLDSFAADDLVVLQNEIPVNAAIMQEAKARGLKIILNPSPFDKRIESLPLALVDIFFVNEIEGAHLAALPTDTPHPVVLDALVARFPSSEIVLTAGKEGAYYGFGAVREKGEIVDTTVEDTTAAGDTFTGYFLAARAQKLPVPQALAIAGKAASLTVSRTGAMESIPFARELQDSSFRLGTSGTAASPFAREMHYV